jgi:hypothetical protein
MSTPIPHTPDLQLQTPDRYESFLPPFPGGEDVQNGLLYEVADRNEWHWNMLLYEYFVPWPQVEVFGWDVWAVNEQLVYTPRYAVYLHVEKISVFA